MRTLMTTQAEYAAPENAEIISRDEDGTAVVFWEFPGGFRAALKDTDVDLIVATRTYPAVKFTREQARTAALGMQRSVTFDQKGI